MGKTEHYSCILDLVLRRDNLWVIVRPLGGGGSKCSYSPPGIIVLARGDSAGRGLGDAIDSPLLSPTIPFFLISIEIVTVLK